MGFFTISDHDIYGHPIQLNYKGEKNSYNTTCGGIISLFIKAFIAFFIGYKFNIMVNRWDDTIRKATSILELEEEGKVYYNETSLNMFWVLRDFRDGYEKPLYLN